jgi:hypothetical protein
MIGESLSTNGKHGANRDIPRTSMIRKVKEKDGDSSCSFKGGGNGVTHSR